MCVIPPMAGRRPASATARRGITRAITAETQAVTAATAQLSAAISPGPTPSTHLTAPPVTRMISNARTNTSAAKTVPFHKTGIAPIAVVTGLAIKNFDCYRIIHRKTDLRSVTRTIYNPWRQHPLTTSNKLIPLNTMSPLKFKISIFVALTLGALVMYFVTSQLPKPVERDLMQEFKAAPTASATTGNQDSNTGVAPVDELLLGLKQRLQSQPNDVDGWVLLSKSYYHLNRGQEADAAFQKAKALGYRGSWQPLPRIDSFSQNSSSVINLKDYKINTDSVQATSQADGVVSQITAGLQLNISLNPALQKELSPDSVVFVFVRSLESPGPPLAVVRTTVGELPFEIALNDSHAMIPSRTISSAGKVIVGARISVSGNSERQPGDYEQLSDSIPADSNKTIEIVITNKI